MRRGPPLFRPSFVAGHAPIALAAGHAWRTLCALLLLTCSQAAFALGLGDIRVLSRPGEPFLAEIPVISNQPGELEQAQVALASPATFARVGLERPQGLVSELQFRFAQTKQGRAVIRVSSTTPVTLPSLSFLIEVDWGQGRLVREYSALIDTPNTATVVDAPAIKAPAAVPSDRIARRASSSVPPSAEAAAPAPVQANRTVTPAAASVASSADALAPVRAGQTLSQIAGQLARVNGHSLDQTMVALLRANPDAFIRGNLNLLKRGAVLRKPPPEELTRLDAAAAAALVREQAAHWRDARTSVPQPVQAQQGSAASTIKPVAATSTAASGARLEIAPAVPAPRRGAGAKSGTGAGNEGDMVATQQLQQAREDLAVRDAEVQELRSRVEQLEKLKTQQQQLLALKDSDLAVAQKRLAQAAPAQPVPVHGSAGSSLWPWAGLSLLVVGVGAWWLSRRRKPSPLPPLSEYDDEAAVLAASVPVVARHEVDALESSPLDHLDRTESHDASVPHQTSHAAAADESDRAQQEDAMDAFEREMAQHAHRHDVVEPVSFAPPIDLHRGDAATAAEPISAETSLPTAEAPWSPSPAPTAVGRQEPTWHPPEVPVVAVPESPYPPVGRERLELAVAYMDLGDHETARTLLVEVAASGDPTAQAEARQLLERLG